MSNDTSKLDLESIDLKNPFALKKLDDLVAKEVMGWATNDNQQYFSVNNYKVKPAYSNEPHKKGYINLFTNGSSFPEDSGQWFIPTQDHNHMALVRKQLNTKDRVTLFGIHTGKLSKINFHDYENLVESVHFSMEIPLAIQCLAAIKAVRDEN